MIDIATFSAMLGAIGVIAALVAIWAADGDLSDKMTMTSFVLIVVAVVLYLGLLITEAFMSIGS